MMAEPPLFAHWYELTMWLLRRTEKLPRRIRFTFSNRIDNLTLDVLQGLTVAMYTKRKAALLDDINRDIDQLRILLRLCHDMTYLDHKAYEHASRQIDEAGRMLGGWRKQQRSRG